MPILQASKDILSTSNVSTSNDMSKMILFFHDEAILTGDSERRYGKYIGSSCIF
jgi:hypothetical protein